ncbi:MAG: pyrroline-5-carboxylate reductase [Tannerella sp.]|jgi:pyrroline-5-carboxylate reductase|nr:pyrroline-5-carboxylate reductase [Tannerella sp.]
MKIAIIGAGNMGGAIARGLCNSRRMNASDIYCSDRSEEMLAKLTDANKDIHVSTDNKEVAAHADIILAAVKPWFLETVIKEIKPFMDYKRQVFVSIAAGIDFRTLCEYLKKEEEIPAMFRVIPNTAIEVKESVNLVSSCNATEKQTDTVKELFDELGLTLVVEERLINAGMALASCGIAYAFRYIRAAIEGAVELGLYPEQAKIIELQTLKGAVALLEKNRSHPEAEIDKVTTPGGITIKGLNAMEEAGFTNAVIKGLKASVPR